MFERFSWLTAAQYSQNQPYMYVLLQLIIYTAILFQNYPACYKMGSTQVEDKKIDDIKTS